MSNEIEIRIPVTRGFVGGTLSLTPEARDVVIFAHGSGSSRFSPRNRYIAGVLQLAGFATLLMDLLSSDEERIDEITAELRFDIPFLGRRLSGVTDWLCAQQSTAGMHVGYFGASTGAAAALVAAAERNDVRAIVSRGGRPDLAGDALLTVQSPTLLVVGGDDSPVLSLNRMALGRLRCKKQMVIVSGASHLFEEAGKLEQVARLATGWFQRHLRRAGAQEAA